MLLCAIKLQQKPAKRVSTNELTEDRCACSAVRNMPPRDCSKMKQEEGADDEIVTALLRLGEQWSTESRLKR